jgi:hypothetical protein
MKNFRTYQMALELYRQGKSQPMKGELKDQFERASLSVVLNLAEGSGKIGKERVKFFRIAMGSLKEVQACLDVAGGPLAPLADHTAACLYQLILKPEGRTWGRRP